MLMKEKYVKSKLLLILLIVILHIAAFGLLIYSLKWALIVFALYGITVVLLLILFIKERLKEKKEEDQYDDRDY